MLFLCAFSALLTLYAVRCTLRNFPSLDLRQFHIPDMSFFILIYCSVGFFFFFLNLNGAIALIIVDLLVYLYLCLCAYVFPTCACGV